MSYSYRSRKLDLKLLESEPQKSLDTVHTILSDSIGDLESRLRQLQLSFYGRGLSATDELHRWSALLKRVVNLTKTNGLFSLNQMEEISWKEADGRGAFANDLLSMHQMMECCHKTEEAVPGVQLNELVIEVRKLLGYLEKYCASFYDPDHDPVIDTAGAYEKQRRRYINVVNDLISKIYQLADKFKSRGSGGEGLRITDLSGYSVELSRRTDVAHAPFLLLFPEAVENIRLALSAMRSWIEDDRNFAAFLENDARELDARRADVQKQVRALSQSYHQLGFRLKQAQVESGHLGEALGKTQDREDALVVEEELLSTQVKDFETELDSTEFRKTEWHKNVAMSSDVYHDKLNELSERIRELRGKIPPTHQQLVTIRSKLRRVESKRADLRTEEKRRKQLEVEMEEVAGQLAEAEVELGGITVSLETARRIVLCKRSSDVVEKIFYQQQVVKPSKGKKKGSQDIFDKACAIVANHISKDWPRLYRVLPFHPPRGLSTIDKDIYDLMNREARGGKQHLARLAIDRWRRNHTRAKVEDLAVALGTIQRSDIVEQMNAKVHPPEPEVVVQSEIPDWVDAELVPYWREIERFDEIMATNSSRYRNRQKTRHAV